MTFWLVATDYNWSSNSVKIFLKWGNQQPEIPKFGHLQLKKQTGLWSGSVWSYSEVVHPGGCLLHSLVFGVSHRCLRAVMHIDTALHHVCTFLSYYHLFICVYAAQCQLGPLQWYFLVPWTRPLNINLCANSPAKHPTALWVTISTLQATFTSEMHLWLWCLLC